MPKTTIFTGAGASKALGYPTTSEFFQGTNLTDHEVYKHARAYLKQSPVDVEDILRLLAPFSELDGTPTGEFLRPHWGGHWVSKIPHFVRQTNDQCFDHYGRLPGDTEVGQAYQALLEAADWTERRVSLFTRRTTIP